MRNGRYLSLAAVVSSPLLLIADLKTPHRWYNMLRIFRRTSPMSIGSWLLTGFGLTTAFTAFRQFMADRKKPGEFAEDGRVPGGLGRRIGGRHGDLYGGTLVFDKQLRGRDILIRRQRETVDAKTVDLLGDINSVLSVLSGGEYPMAGIRFSRLKEAKNALARLLD